MGLRRSVYRSFRWRIQFWLRSRRAGDFGALGAGSAASWGPHEPMASCPRRLGPGTRVFWTFQGQEEGRKPHSRKVTSLRPWVWLFLYVATGVWVSPVAVSARFPGHRAWGAGGSDPLAASPTVAERDGLCFF